MNNVRHERCSKVLKNKYATGEKVGGKRESNLLQNIP